MPFTPTSFYSASGTFSGSDTNTRMEEIEEYLNGRISGQDIAEKTITGEHIRPPRFFGSPAPRGEFVSSDIHHRGTDMSNQNAHIMWDACSEDWEPIPGLAVTMHVHPQGPTDTVTVNVLANWFCRDITDNTKKNTSRPNTHRACSYQLFVKRGTETPAAVPGTERLLYSAGGDESRLSCRNLSICAMVELMQGVNHIYVAIRSDNTDMKNAWRIYHFARNIICDVMYL